MTNHKFNYSIRLYIKGDSKYNFYQYTINARDNKQAMYLILKHFIKKHPELDILRVRVYSVTKNTPKTIKINIPSISH